MESTLSATLARPSFAPHEAHPGPGKHKRHASVVIAATAAGDSKRARSSVIWYLETLRHVHSAAYSPPPLLAARCCGKDAHCTYLLDVGSLGEVHVVDGVDDELCSDVTATEETTLKTLDGVLSALYAIELDVNLAIGRAGSDTNVDDLTVTVLALAFDVLFELLLPAWLVGTAMMVSGYIVSVKVIDLLSLRV